MRKDIYLVTQSPYKRVCGSIVPIPAVIGVKTIYCSIKDKITVFVPKLDLYNLIINKYINYNKMFIAIWIVKSYNCSQVTWQRFAVVDNGFLFYFGNKHKLTKSWTEQLKAVKETDSSNNQLFTLFSNFVNYISI